MLLQQQRQQQQEQKSTQILYRERNFPGTCSPVKDTHTHTHTRSADRLVARNVFAGGIESNGDRFVVQAAKEKAIFCQIKRKSISTHGPLFVFCTPIHYYIQRSTHKMNLKLEGKTRETKLLGSH